MSQTLDACGRACPEPVILTKKALSARPPACRVLVDNAAAAGNVTRFAENAGYTVAAACRDGVYTLDLTRS